MRPNFTLQPFHKNGKYDYNNDEILHREGEWCLRKTVPGTDWSSYLHHNVDKNIIQQNPWVDGTIPGTVICLKKIGCEWSDLPLDMDKCSKCLSSIPAGILGLWKMHNWDMIQRQDRNRYGYFL